MLNSLRDGFKNKINKISDKMKTFDVSKCLRYANYLVIIDLIAVIVAVSAILLYIIFSC